ncbi:hypothetical protein MMC29_005122 [Sticta canariensis]|nr:hypothetical protein [Sticta canariensis]
MSLVGKMLSGAIAFAASLSQTQTNGNSILGTLSAPALSVSKVNPHVSSIDPIRGLPDTKRTVSYVFNVTRQVLSPDGYQKSMIVVNGAFPGPLIEANWGDWISGQLGAPKIYEESGFIVPTDLVTVNNQIESPSEGTSIHWHGLLQRETPWYDGVPGGQQCPIAPGTSFKYIFRADTWGTSWYHSHYSAQYTQGLVGPIVIHGPNHVPYDIDLGPVMVTDMFHTDYKTIVAGVTGNNPARFAARSDNNLINGKMFSDCSLVTDGTPCTSNAGLSEFRLTRGKTHRLRVINGGSAGLQHFSIDNHVMTIIANDFVPIEPYQATVLTMGIGQRTDILVTANQDPSSSYWMRSNISTICGLPNQPDSLAVISYGSANTTGAAKVTKKPSSVAWPFTYTTKCNNNPLNDTIPVFPIPVKAPTTTLYLGVNSSVNSTGHLLWTMNGRAFRDDDSNPILELANQKNATNIYDPYWNVYNLESNSTVRLIVKNEQSAATNISHPFHIHGHDFQVLDEGDGAWDGTTIINAPNPQRRDTQMLRPGGYIVLQFEADNPGVWPFHCHVAWHVSGGLYINLLEQPQSIAQLRIPNGVSESCRAWKQYSNVKPVEVIGGGL